MDNYDIAAKWFAEQNFLESDDAEEFTSYADEQPGFNGVEDTMFVYSDGSGFGVCLVKDGKVVAGAVGGESYQYGSGYIEVTMVEGPNIGRSFEHSHGPGDSDEEMDWVNPIWDMLHGEY